MYLFFFTTLFMIIFHSTSLNAEITADCFKQQGDSYTKPAKGTTRISAGVACPQSQKKTCSVPTGGFVNATSTVNITGAVATVYDAVGKVINAEFPAYLYGAASNATYNVQLGMTGFYGFTVTYRCYAGVLGNCIADIANGTALEACMPTALQGRNSLGVPNLEGSTNFVSTDPQTIANMTTNPALSGPANLYNTDSGGAKVGIGGTWLMAIVVIAVWLLL